MQYRRLGKTDFNVSSISFGSWAIGGDWGSVEESDALSALNKAIDLGVNLIDTADVYGDGRSEKLIAKLLHERKEEVFVATKAGRRLNPHTADGYNPQNLSSFIDRSLKNLKVEAIDLLQLHCPPTDVYYNPEVFDFLDEQIQKGKIRYYGVSVEKVEEALKAIEYPNVSTVQIIFNMFRLRPSELFFKEAQKKDIGILARVPLASGLLSGKFNENSRFDPKDHRNFNRHGEAFDVGETFSGVDYQLGLKAVEELKAICPDGISLVQFALRWILMFDAVSCAIPGAKKTSQVEENISASEIEPFAEKIMHSIEDIYNRYIRSSVHQCW